MSFINFNGKTFDQNTPIIEADNRGLKFGDGLFETLKFKNGNLILIDEHLSRLWKGMKLLQFEIPKLFTPDFIEAEILNLLKKNKHTNARIRLNVIRSNGGLYDVQNFAPHYIIQTWELPENNGQLNQNGLQCSIYRDILKPIDQLSNCKHNNFMTYTMGALFAKKEKCNDAIILNQNKCITDSTIANVFLIKDQNIFTPLLSEGPIAGIMRDWVIKELKKGGFNINETVISEEMLMNADEVFLTNSIYNIRWVAAIGNKTYTLNKTLEIYNYLSRTNKEIFC